MRRLSLDNGLRAVVVPRPGCRVVAVSVVYRAGFRDEQPGQAGLAHLFEHLMTQGSPSLEKLEHKRRIESAGGWYSGSTRADCTPYVSTIPAAALEMALACEADRMRGVRLTQENVDNQISVVEQEIRGNVLSVPFGGFPCFQVDAALFQRFENRHDGYGPFEDLRRVSLEDAAAFHERYYVPANAVVSVVGDVDEDEVELLVRRWFEPLPHRAPPPPRDVDEPAPPEELRSVVIDPLASASALGVGYRAPSPAQDWRGYVTARLVGDLLAGRLRGRPVGEARPALGSLGDWLASDGPAQLTLGVGPFPTDRTEQVLSLFDEQVEQLAEVGEEEVRRAASLLATALERSQEQAYVTAQAVACVELLHGDPERVRRLPGLLRDLSACDVAELVRQHLLSRHRAVVEVRPA